MFYICLLDEMAEGYFTNYDSNSWGMILGCWASSFQCRFLDFWEKNQNRVLPLMFPGLHYLVLILTLGDINEFKLQRSNDAT